VVGSGQELVWGIRFLSLPHCFASTCDVDKVAKDLEGFIDDAVVEFEERFSSCLRVSSVPRQCRRRMELRCRLRRLLLQAL
jgi:hypothetical protein